MVFSSRGKCTKANHATSVAVNSGEIGRDTKQDYLLHLLGYYLCIYMINKTGNAENKVNSL